MLKFELRKERCHQWQTALGATRTMNVFVTLFRSRNQMVQKFDLVANS